MKKQAMFYERQGNRVRCQLCPHNCLLGEGQKGICHVREAMKDDGGILHLYTLNYGEVTAVALDPIEKKPLTHFYPGTIILSIGSFGCNLGCTFCQNHQIAHGSPSSQYCLPEEMVEVLKQYPQSTGIAFTYNEPSIWYEYVYDTSRLIKTKLLDKKVVLVTNGYIHKEPLKQLLPFVDAMNIDLKGDQAFYEKLCKGSLEEVKQTIRLASEAGCHVEVTNLLIEEQNTHIDQLIEMGEFLKSVNPDIVLHLSRYFPNYQMTLPPTSFKFLQKAYQALKQILPYVEVGNISYEEKLALDREIED